MCEIEKINMEERNPPRKIFYLTYIFPNECYLAHIYILSIMYVTKIQMREQMLLGLPVHLQ